MDQQEQGRGASRAPDDDAQAHPGQPQADEGANDSTWGVGSASAMEQLRRHDFRVRRSKPPESDERPQSE